MEYNIAIVEKCRKLAVTDINDVKVGSTYFYFRGADTVDEATVLSVGSYEEYKPTATKHSFLQGTMWAKFSDRPEEMCSLNDINVGSSYNPWMIFDDEATAAEYSAAISPSIVYGNRTQLFDDYDLFGDSEHLDYDYDNY